MVTSSKNGGKKSDTRMGHLLVVAVALQAKNGRILMQRRPRHKHHGGLWEFPGGKVEPSENPDEALIREIQEELGIDILPDHLTPMVFARESAGDRDKPIVILLYTCRIWEGDPVSQEGCEVDWFSSEEIKKLAKPPLDVMLAKNLKLFP